MLYFYCIVSGRTDPPYPHPSCIVILKCFIIVAVGIFHAFVIQSIKSNQTDMATTALFLTTFCSVSCPTAWRTERVTNFA